MPRSLDLERLRRFEPVERAQGASAVPESTEDPPRERWPSREALRDGQISIKAPLETLVRFRRLCRDDRRTYADMLEILMEAFEQGQK